MRSETADQPLPRVLLFLLMAVSLVLTALVPAAHAADLYPDVSDGHPFFDEIQWITEQGIAEGYEDGEFKPRRDVTRQAMVAFLHRIEGAPEGPFENPGFTDVLPGHPFYDEIAWAVETGVAQGFGDSTFRPTVPVSRQATSAFMYRLAGAPQLPGGEEWANDFSDVDEDHQFHTEISWMASVGITQGYDDGEFKTMRSTTRQAMAAFIMRYVLTTADVPDNEITVRLNWQNEYRDAEGAFGGVDEYAAFHLDDEGAGEVTLRWDTDTGLVETEGETTLTSAGAALHLHTGALDAEGPVAIPLPAPTFVGDPGDEPGTGDDDRGDFTYSLDGRVMSSGFTDTLEALDAALAADGLVDYYVNVHTVHNPAGEVRGQLGAGIDDGGLEGIVPLFKYFEFHELGTGTNTGEDQTSFNLWFDADIDYAGDTGQTRPGPGDFELTINGEPHPILRVRGNNPDWQPYPKQDMRIHLDTHDVIEDGDIVEITMLDSGAAKLLPVGRNSGAEDLSDSWRTRCTVVLSVAAMTSEPCGTPPQPGLSNFAATAIDSAPHQQQTFSVTIEEPGIPAGEELWVDLIDVSHDGLVDYSDSAWTATVDGVEVGTVEFWELEIEERFETVWEPFIVFTHDEDVPVGGELVLSGTGIDGSDAAVLGEAPGYDDYDTYVVRHDTGRADYTEIRVNYVPQPTITLEPADAVLLADVGASQSVTATYTDVDGVPVAGAEIRFWAEKGERPDIVEEELSIETTDANGQATVTYVYDGRHVAVGEPLIDTLNAEAVDDTFVDAETTVTWATGVATNDGPGEALDATYHDLNDAVVDAEVGDTITAKGEFTSVYGLPRGDRIEIRTAGLTLQAADDPAGASLLGAFDVRANGVTVDGFDVEHAGNMQYAFRVEGDDITISNNDINANGADGFRVRDAWRAVDGGGSATISGNEISDAIIAIDVDNRDQTTALVTDLTITGNSLVNNEVGIHYNADGGTPSISGNAFEAGETGNTYVRDATDSEDLDLEAILGANTYDPAAEILGRSIVPIDPEHTPSIVRVVEHGTGQGNQYTVIEYTRGVACDGGLATGEQFTLDRGTETTPNRKGVAVDCDYGPNQIKITWDGNPSFPNEIFYNQHPQAQYRIHNEHNPDAHAVSPDDVGPPFLKPDDDAAVSGAVYLTTGGFTVDGLGFEQGDEVSDVELGVRISDRSEPANLSLWFDGARPGEDFIAGETICEELLTEESCLTVTEALTANDPFTGDTVFLSGETLQVEADAAPGDWQLRWWVVDADTSEAYFSDTFTVTITATTNG